MGPTSLRVKSTLFAVVITTIAVVVGAIVLLAVLRQSLTSQIDDELFQRSFDVIEGIETLGFPDDTLLPGDWQTIAVVFDDQDEVIVSNLALLDSMTAEDLLTSLPGEDLEESYDVGTGDQIPAFTVRLPGDNFTETRTLGLLGSDSEPTYWVYLGRTLQSVNETVDAARRWALIAGPLLIALIGGLTWWLTGRTLRRVEQLATEVDEITATADLSRRVNESRGDDELAQLSTTMNQMLERLQLNESRQQRFMSDAAHELRSPLASINAQLDVDLAHPLTAEWPATAVAVRQDTARLQRIIEDLLALARSESAPATLHRLVDLDDVIFDQAHAIKRPDGITIDVSGVGAGAVRGSQDQFERVIVNLLANAVRHAHSTVHVVLTVDGGEALVVVNDDGDGVDPKDHRVIFDRFVRLDEARSRDQGGTGLGLALTREIIEAHGGTIAVGTSPTGGARFEVRLPAA